MNKKMVLLKLCMAFCLSLASVLQAAYSSAVAIQRVQESSHSLFDQNYQPTQPLLDVLTLVGMEEAQHSRPSIFAIHSWAQKNLLRQGERWEKQTDRFESLAPQLLPLLDQLGLIQEVRPPANIYKGALVHGASLPRVRHRIYELVEQWKRGVRFHHLYLLGGERPLEPLYEDEEALLSDTTSPLTVDKNWNRPATLPKTESEMMRFVWEQADIPQDMRQQLQLHVINAPMKTTPHALARPTTRDTIDYWLQSSPLQGAYLAVTHAPYILRQDLVMQKLLPEEYTVDTLGPAASPHEKMVIILDELARAISEVTEIAEKALL